MPTLLHVDASPRGSLSISRQLSAAAVSAWKHDNPRGKVIARDLCETKMCFVDLDWIVGSRGTPEQQTDSTKRALALSDELVAEVLEADEIVIGTPMYNFAIPAVLKAWIDHVVRPGKTFTYTAAEPEGLAKGRRAVIAIASGGSYYATSGWDYESPYLRHIFGFIGITDVTFIQASGTMKIVQGKVTLDKFLEPLLRDIAAAV